MFRRPRPSMSDLYEARIADLKEAHEARVREMLRTIEALAEQIDYLRAVFGRAQPMSGSLTRQGTTVPFELPVVDDLPLHMSEEEEDLIAMADNELISEEQLARMQAQLAERFKVSIPITE